jgi:hypothetical protein
LSGRHDPAAFIPSRKRVQPASIPDSRVTPQRRDSERGVATIGFFYSLNE